MTILLWGLWGLVSKLASQDMDASSTQVYFALGLLPLMAILWRGARPEAAIPRKAGMSWAFITGLLGGAGNMAFFEALVLGGKASVVMPLTALYPIVTVVLALIFLRERLGHLQKLGLAFAIGAIYLLSVPG